MKHKSDLRKMLASVYAMIWLLAASPQVFGQSVPPLGPGTYTSPSAVTNGVSVESMIHIDYKSLFNLRSSRKGGINGSCVGCNVFNGHKITLRVYTYDPSKPGGKGKVIYDVFSLSVDSDIETYIDNPSGEVPIPSIGFPITVSTNNMKRLASTYEVYSADGCALTQPLTWQETITNLIHFLSDPIEPRCLKYYDAVQPVIVELKIPRDSHVNRIIIPGYRNGMVIGAKDFFTSKTAKVYVNGALRQTFQSDHTGTPATVNAVMGDDVRIEVTGAGNNVPDIEGVPQTWLAQFAGEAQYICSPNAKPGEYNPWIGFDSNVHGSALRSYEQFPDFQEQLAPWSKNGSNYSWTWQAQRRMSASKTNFSSTYTWNKQKTLNGGKKQRNNQKEGLDMQLLRTWPGWDSGNKTFQSYDGPKYLLGLDPDEIMYVNSQYPATTSQHAPSALLSPEARSNGQEEWQYVPNSEGNASSINWMVTAYRRHKEAVSGHRGTVEFYDGYEIQDNGTSPDLPNGSYTGNNEAPGLVTVTTGGTAIKMKFNVEAPFSTDRGFYGHILGTKWPAQGAQNVPYSLRDIIPSKIDNYILEYMNVSSFGKVTRTTYHLRDEPQSVKNQVMSTGSWTKNFNISGNSGYNTITAYYQRTTASKRVMIAGKELLEIQLRFVGVPGNSDPENPHPPGIALGEDRGEGGYIYVEEYRSQSEPDFDYQRFGRFIDPFVTTYTFTPGTQVSFSTLDGDPHTFVHSGTEWYLSERTQAKRIPADIVNNYLHYYIDTIHPDGSISEASTPTGSGRTFTHTWQTPGTYRLRVVYNTHGNSNELTGSNYVFHKVNIVDHGSTTHGSSPKGKIVVRDLTNQERQHFGFLPTSMKIAYVDEVYSSWKFKEGPRARRDASTNQQNRFSKFNDYADAYTWKGKSGNSTFNSLSNPIDVQNWIDSHNNLAWFPDNWVRHYNPDRPEHSSPHWPEDVDTKYFRDLSTVTSQIDALFSPTPPESWQQRFRWISTTPYQGPRVRTNIKVIYDMEKFWDNHTGAFSGTPNIPGGNAIPFWSPSDAQQDEEKLYYDLLHGRAIIFDASNVNGLQVWNPDPTSASTTTFIAEYAGSGSQARLAENEIVEEEEAPLTPEIEVFPNPANEWVIARVALLESQTVQAALVDLKGNILFNFNQQLDKGWNTLNIDVNGLARGVYILKLRSGKHEWSEQLLIE